MSGLYSSMTSETICKTRMKPWKNVKKFFYSLLFFFTYFTLYPAVYTNPFMSQYVIVRKSLIVKRN